jgi:hypothetical protein
VAAGMAATALEGWRLDGPLARMPTGGRQAVSCRRQPAAPKRGARAPGHRLAGAAPRRAFSASVLLRHREAARPARCRSGSAGVF